MALKQQNYFKMPGVGVIAEEIDDTVLAELLNNELEEGMELQSMSEEFDENNLADILMIF